MEILRTIQELLQEHVKEVRYIDEDWGQLDSYTPNPPVQWPCILIDEDQASFSDIGTNPRAVPKNRQQARVFIGITVANLKLTNTSARAPLRQKNAAWSIWSIIDSVHNALHGALLSDNTGRILRRSRQRQKRDDGIQQYHLIYEVELSNV